MELQLNSDEVMKKVRLCSQALGLFEDALKNDVSLDSDNKGVFLEDLKLVHASIETFLRTVMQLNNHPDYLYFWKNNLDLIIRVLGLNGQFVKNSFSLATYNGLIYFITALIDLMEYVSANGSKNFDTDAIKRQMINDYFKTKQLAHFSYFK